MNLIHLWAAGAIALVVVEGMNTGANIRRVFTEGEPDVTGMGARKAEKVRRSVRSGKSLVRDAQAKGWSPALIKGSMAVVATLFILARGAAWPYIAVNRLLKWYRGDFK